jgi:hypothetical protein
MADITDSESLSRRVTQLEHLFMALFLYENDGNDDEVIYELRRFLFRPNESDSSINLSEILSLLRNKNSARNISRREYYVENRSDYVENRSEDSKVSKLVLRNQLEYLQSEVESLKNRIELLQSETHSMLALQAMGILDSQVKSQRFIPVRAYIDETPDGAINTISSAIKEVLSAYGFEVTDEFPEIEGSWFKKWFVKSTDTLSRPEVTERLDKVERAIDLQILNRPQADIDEKQSAAIANLIKALENIPNAAIQSGSVLVVKLTTPNGSVIQARTLSQDEMVQLENNQLLLQDPSRVLYELSAACLNSRKQASSKLRDKDIG